MLGELIGLNNIRLEPLKSYDAAALIKNLPKVNSFVEINVLEKIGDIYKILIEGKLFQSTLNVKLNVNDAVIAKVISHEPFTVSLDNLVQAKNLNESAVTLFLNKLNLPHTENSVKALLAFIRADKPLVKEKLMKLIEILDNPDFEDSDSTLEMLVKILSASEERLPLFSKNFIRNFQRPIEKLISETFELVKSLNRENLPKEIIEKLNSYLVLDMDGMDSEAISALLKNGKELLKEIEKIIFDGLNKGGLPKEQIAELKNLKDLLERFINQGKENIPKDLEKLQDSLFQNAGKTKQEVPVKGNLPKDIFEKLNVLIQNENTGPELLRKDILPKEIMEKLERFLLPDTNDLKPEDIARLLKGGKDSIKELIKFIAEELSKGSLPKQEMTEMKNLKETLDNYSYQKMFYEKMGVSPEFFILKEGGKYKLAQYNIERTKDNKGKEIFKINLRMSPENLGDVIVNGALSENSLNARFYSMKEVSGLFSGQFNELTEILQNKLNITGNFSSAEILNEKGIEVKLFDFTKSIDVKA